MFFRAPFVALAFGLALGSSASAQPVVWAQRAAIGPSPRSYVAVAYDSAPSRRVTVLFGGYTGAHQFDYNNDTWEWNGCAWTQRFSTGALPSPRVEHAMAYDSARGVTVLFGGATGLATESGETWEWDGTAWIQRMVTGPSPRDAHAMAYDAARGETVLFGGYGDNDETWVWNGNTWTRKFVSGPSRRWGHAMAYDTVRQVTVLFGGYTYEGLIVYGDTWEWNGEAWTERCIGCSGLPSPRVVHAMAYDADRRVTVLFGGASTNGGVENSETWEWNGTVWTPRPILGPAPRELHAMAFDSYRHKCVLFGGQNGGGLRGDTWDLSCQVDADGSGAVTVADIFAFLNAWFAGDLSADFDHIAGLNVSDIFAFLNAWFVGC